MTAPVRASTRDQMTTAHSEGQALISAWVAEQMARIWPALDQSRLDETGPLWIRLATDVIRAGREQSALLAGTWHAADRAVALRQRSADEAIGRFGTAIAELRRRTGSRLPASLNGFVSRAGDVEPAALLRAHPPPPLNSARISSSLAVTGPIVVKRTQDAAKAQRRSADAARRHSLNAGRELIDRRIRTDDRAIGWIRVPDDDACAFCMMLASRAEVYKKENAATYTDRGGKKDTYHDKCGCMPRPVYSESDERPANNRRAAELWEAHAQGLPAAKGRSEFRKAVAALQAA